MLINFHVSSIFTGVVIFDYDNAISVVDNVPASLWWQRFISFADHYHITASYLSNVELLISVSLPLLENPLSLTTNSFLVD